ncbi:hypothetical protein A9995_02110 [Erythrobacter sp. QSSC1-22B]|uniref:hypothetical protein n=1 Tax=Erythrobacter sp. QSSC1-22B TaxID=1860125 RepID=UPI00080607A0|nr:hypothetical protein [Erythrobacter sp. QSSC1-22B]OBX20526.1 hypothetical protein A9995_02110 [Erythrobacter sp. QSSC1-22B]
MKTITKALAKGSMATIAAGAMAMTSATPAFAQSRDRDNGIGAGEIIAGAVILGGIAIAAGALGGSRDRYDDRRYQDPRYQDPRYQDPRYQDRRYQNNRYQNNRYARQVDPRTAVQRCVAAAENDARRYGYRYANVTQIRDVRDNRNGFRVRGDLVVDGQRNSRYDRRGNQRADQGRFNCQVDYRGQIQNLNYNGIRGLR